jgi:AraC-like DNA-binding protein
MSAPIGNAPAADLPEVVRRAGDPALRHAVLGLTGYRENGTTPPEQREAAPVAVPLIISFGTPFRIAFDRAPARDDAQPSFMVGLHAGAVHIRSDGTAECVQLDLTPVGAHRLLGGALVELGLRMVDVEALFGADGRALRERLGEERGWLERFALVEAFVACRMRHATAPELRFAWRRLAETGGCVPVAVLAEETGWSRQHLATRFRREFGLGPKQAARLLRFRHARRLAVRGMDGGWADIAAASGYADQAHLSREFAALAGEPPTAWARRAGARASLGTDAALR